MAASAASSSIESVNEGPVLSLISKRLRALRKKLNRISQMEESVSQGRTLNKEQDETLRSKSSVLAGIDELEKLRQPLCEALSLEVSLAFQNHRKAETKEVRDEEARKPDAQGANDGVSDLLRLLYFGNVFDVQTLVRAHDNVITRTHERSSCLTYDYVTDDDTAGDPLKEWDLDLISTFGSLLISRPMNSSFTHKNALENCVEHARLWIANSGHLIDPNLNITYAALKEKLEKIMTSEYFTTAPAIKAPVEVAAAAGNYKSFQVPVHESMFPIGGVTAQVEVSDLNYQQQQEESLEYESSESYDEKTGASEVHQGGSEDLENAYEVPVQTESEIPDVEVDQNSRDLDSHEQQHAPRRPYWNYRGGRGGNGGGRRGYPNSRGGRGSGRGSYQNGLSQFYDQPGNHYHRNYNYRGRGGRGIDSNYNASAGPGSHAQAAS